MKVGFLFAVILFSPLFLLAQKTEYTYASIADSFKQQANAVVRLDQTNINVSSQRSMSIKHRRVVTVLNDRGKEAMNTGQYYNKSTSVKNIEAVILDAFGNEIKKIKRKDFEDYSVAGGSTMFSDVRIVTLDYTPVQYPFTMIFDCEINTSSTAFIPDWMPLTGYLESVEKIVLQVTYPENLGFRKKEIHFDSFAIQKKSDSATGLTYIAENITARVM